jgi:hypothetical protein
VLVAATGPVCRARSHPDRRRATTNSEARPGSKGERVADRPLRKQARAIVCELEPDYVLERAGQTVRYFSHDYLVDVLANWQIITLDHLELEYGCGT